MCSLNACHVLKKRGSLLWQNCSTVCWESLVEAIELHHLTEETDYGFLNSNNTLYGWPWVKEWSRNNFNPSVNPDFVLLAFENCKQGPLQNSLEYRTLGLAAGLWWGEEGELCSEANLSPWEWSTCATHHTATTAVPSLLPVWAKALDVGTRTHAPDQLYLVSPWKPLHRQW